MTKTTKEIRSVVYQLTRQEVEEAITDYLTMYDEDFRKHSAMADEVRLTCSAAIPGRQWETELLPVKLHSVFVEMKGETPCVD